MEVNYGAALNLQLHVMAAFVFDDPFEGRSHMGLGDTELGAKYRFIIPGSGDWWPQVAAFPLVEIPVGDARYGFGEGHTRVFLPIWIQKDFGKWTTYGGSGYWISPGLGNRNYWFAGWLLQRQVTDQPLIWIFKRRRALPLTAVRKALKCALNKVVEESALR
jgi:hypothetical protein